LLVKVFSPSAGTVRSPGIGGGEIVRAGRKLRLAVTEEDDGILAARVRFLLGYKRRLRRIDHAGIVGDAARRSRLHHGAALLFPEFQFMGSVVMQPPMAWLIEDEDFRPLEAVAS